MTEKQRVTVQISSALMNRLKNAVYWTPGITISSSIESNCDVVTNEVGTHFRVGPQQLAVYK